MGERGPAPEPIALRVLKDTNHKPIPENIPRPKGLVPDCPPWLDEDAQTEWEEIVLLMGEVPNWLTQVNKTTLAGHCHWYSVWKNAEAVLTREGRFYDVVQGVDEDGAVSSTKKLHPMVKVSKEAWESMIKCDRELGITPARGSSVRLPPAGDPHDEEGLDSVGRTG